MPSEIYQHIGERLRYVREKLGYSLEDVASLPNVRINVSSLDGYERARHKVDFDKLAELSTAYGVSFSYLTTGIDRRDNVELRGLSAEDKRYVLDMIAGLKHRHARKKPKADDKGRESGE